MRRCWLVLALATGCHVSPDYSHTSYQCDDGVCPSGFTCVNARCVLVGDGGIDAIDGNTGGDAARDWWDASWRKRAPLTITNPSTLQLDAGFPVMVMIQLSSLDPGATSDDPRIVYKDPGSGVWSERPHYLEGNSRWWFDVAAPLAAGAANTTDYWVYFGNPAPPATTASGSAVFTFYDGFSSTSVNTAKWAVSGAPTEAADSLNLNAGDSVRSLAQYGPGYAVTASFTVPTTNYRWWTGFQRQTDFNDSDPWMIWIDRASTDSNFPSGYTQGTIWPETNIVGVTPGIVYGAPAQTVDTAKHFYTVQRQSDRIIYKYDEQKVYEYMLPQAYTTTNQVRLANEGTQQIQIGAVHVRRSVWPDPTVAIGATENY